ncbi:MAG: 3-methylcrotonyl-CoA carboxylase, partial [Pseudomonadales bacterium]|nr:3-methylcrotonyl-CoA carboxylase [Pseudomonadales bacterium]
MTQFDSILVANRGEIAVRVIRSAQLQGYKAIAVYSEADAGAPHVVMADEAVLIGAAPVKESYLDPEKILDAARKTGAQAIHPGYGFLSENAEFAEACEKAGLVFIGPSAEAIRVMGNKAESKRRMIEADVPCIGGYQGVDQEDEALFAAAKKIGTPIMVKAAAGGGGRGMRLVEKMEDLAVAISSARSEAENAFGSGELILEKALMQPRHVEIQVFGDQHGNVV